MATLTTASNKSLDSLLAKVIKQATVNSEGFCSRLRVTAKQKALVAKFCKNYSFTTDNSVTYEVNFSEPQNDQLPIYFYGRVVAEMCFPTEVAVSEPVAVSKTQLKKDLATAKRELKEASREYDRVACKSINPDADMAVGRALSRKYDLQAKVAKLTQQLAD